MTDPIRTLEDMSLPCPEDMCDGSGMIMGDDGLVRCLCKTDKERLQEY